MDMTCCSAPREAVAHTFLFSSWLVQNVNERGHMLTGTSGLNRHLRQAGIAQQENKALSEGTPLFDLEFYLKRRIWFRQHFGLRQLLSPQGAEPKCRTHVLCVELVFSFNVMHAVVTNQLPTYLDCVCSQICPENQRLVLLPTQKLLLTSYKQAQLKTVPLLSYVNIYQWSLLMTQRLDLPSERILLEVDCCQMCLFKFLLPIISLKMTL